MSDGASVMTSAKGGEGARFRKDFASTIINIYYIHHRLTLACADRGDDCKFINSFMKLWKFFKNSSNYGLI